jgi:hypothetical protein
MAYALLNTVVASLIAQKNMYTLRLGQLFGQKLYLGKQAQEDIRFGALYPPGSYEDRVLQMRKAQLQQVETQLDQEIRFVQNDIQAVSALLEDVTRNHQEATKKEFGSA